MSEQASLFLLTDPHSGRTPSDSAAAAEKWCAELPAKYTGIPLTQEPVTLLLEQADAIKRLERELRRAEDRLQGAYREMNHQAGIVQDVRRVLSDWAVLREAETALRSIANRVGYYIAAGRTS